MSDLIENNTLQKIIYKKNIKIIITLCNEWSI